MTEIKRFGAAIVLPVLAFLASVVVMRSQVGDLRDSEKEARTERSQVLQRMSSLEAKVDILLERLPKR